MTFDLDTLWTQTHNSHVAALDSTFSTLKDDFENIAQACLSCIQNGGKIMFFGNGGSAADAQHLATELSIRYISDRPAIAGLALTTDTSTLTAAGNDIGFENIFARQIDAIGREGDIAIGISTSGNSANILNALSMAQKKSITTIGLSGRDGGKMVALCDHALVVPHDETARIQEIHIILGHMLCAALEQSLGLV